MYAHIYMTYAFQDTLAAAPVCQKVALSWSMENIFWGCKASKLDFQSKSIQRLSNPIFVTDYTWLRQKLVVCFF